MNKIHRIEYDEIFIPETKTSLLIIDKTPDTSYDVQDIDLNKVLTYDEWIAMINAKPEDWKTTIDNSGDALKILIKLNQQEFITKEMKEKMAMFMDDDKLWRCRSRLDNADWTFEEKFPVILPRCEFTTSLLKHVHEKDEHSSVNYTLANLRMKYFIPKARQQLIRIVNKCAKCRAMKAKPLVVSMGDVPAERINRTQPFTNIGVDLFELKTEPKATGMIFTCCVTRSVHFELLDSAKAEDVCHAFLIFADLNQMPEVIYSDNGTNFKRLSMMMKNAMALLKEKFHWHFNTPASPFRGGFFESLIKTMKKAFYSITWQKKVDRKEVRRILYRIQAIMNARPLIHDSDTILTPNHLRYGWNVRGPVAPPRTGGQPESLLTYWRGTQRLINAAWKTYRDVYMKGVRSFYFNKGDHQSVNVGDTVLVVDDHLPTALWRIGKVIGIQPDKSGKVRTYRILMGDKELCRPAQRIAPLEAVSERGEEMVKK